MADEGRRFVVCFGLEIRDQEKYRAYRERMTPILREHGGEFAWDFTVSEALKRPSDARIDRVFAMAFGDERAQEAFFADPAYRAVRAEWFEPAVASVTKLGAYDER